MMCNAVSLTGRRCDQRVGRADRARRYQLCARHSRSSMLWFMRACRLHDRLMRPDGTPDDERFEVLIDSLRRSCAAFGPATVADVVGLAADVPNVGSLDDYMAAVLAVVIPRLQVHVDELSAETRRVAEDARWHELLARFDPITTH